MNTLQTIIVIICSIIYVSIECVFAYGRHLARIQPISDLTPEYAAEHQEIKVHNRHNGRWIKASPIVILARKTDVYDLWMPK